MIAFSGIVCSGHKIACKKWNNTFVTVNNDFLVTREVICQWFSLVTSSLVKIIGKSPHSWPKIVIHGNSCIILYIPTQIHLQLMGVKRLRKSFLVLLFLVRNYTSCYCSTTRRPLLLTWFIIIPKWRINYSHYKVWDRITCPFPNFNGATVDVWKWLSIFIPHVTGHVFTHPLWE